jgi:hypothetical protein
MIAIFRMGPQDCDWNFEWIGTMSRDAIAGQREADPRRYALVMAPAPGYPSAKEGRRR